MEDNDERKRAHIVVTDEIAATESEQNAENAENGEQNAEQNAEQTVGADGTRAVKENKIAVKDDVSATLRELDAEKKENLSKKVAKRPIWLSIIMIIFFPFTVIVLALNNLFHKVKIRLTVKMTIIYTLLFAIMLVGVTVFFISNINTQMQAGAEKTEFVNTLIVTSVILIIALVALFASLCAVSSQVMLKPIRSITQKIDEITSENLSTRLNQVDNQDELMELTNRINSMLDNLEESFLRQQNFVADASHELKTPIAVIQGYANLLKRWGKEKSEILEEGIEAIAKESDNMKRIVEQLLLLARLGNMSMNNARFNLSEEVNDMVDDYKIVDPKHMISFFGDENIILETDKNLLLESIRTLVDNAIKYTPAGGGISVGCRLVGEKAQILVTDTGIGIGADDLPHIFERFYRCDKARGREKGSSGLGLTIAKSIIEAMDGEIEVKSEMGKGTTFIITLY